MVFLILIGFFALVIFAAKKAKTTAVQHPEAAKEIGKQIIGFVGRALKK